ncbi:MAG: LysR family transcriptional regulator [Pseudomonadota bacterium]
MTNWNDYRYLIATDRFGSLAAAAVQLGVSQPTVGRRIAALEEDLNIALLERAPDGVRLTEAGRQICEEARTLERQVTEIERQARSGRQKQSAPVRITASEGVAHALITPLLAQMKCARPGIMVDLCVSHKLADLRRNAADIALRIGEPLDEALIGRKLGQARFGLYADASYLTNHGVPQDLGDLANHAIIESRGDMSNLIQARTLRDLAAEARVSYAADNLPSQLAALRAGFGILAMPTYVAAANPDFYRVLPDQFDLARDLWVLANPQTINTPSVRAVLDDIAEHLPKRLRMVSAHAPIYPETTSDLPRLAVNDSNLVSFPYGNA